MRDSEETIRYEVTVSGDQWDHEAFRESVHEIDGASIESEIAMETEDDVLETFMCFLCESPPDIGTKQEAIDHLVDEHGEDREKATEAVEELMA